VTTLFDTIRKPTLLLDREKTIRNIRRMAENARRAGVRFRPHFKTHQSAQVGEWFRPQGVSAITVSSVDMALYFAAHGWQDITIAFPVNLRQAEEINELVKRIHLGLLVESREAVEMLKKRLAGQVDIWMKIDAGNRRTGIPWERADEVEAVARAVRGTSNFRLRGLLTHAGQTYTAGSLERVCQIYAETRQRLDGLRRELAARGLPGLELSVGDTPACSRCADLGGVDELRPGNFVFYDAEQIDIGSCGWEDVSVALACPVVALHPEREQAVIYGGAIHLSKDFYPLGERRCYGLVCLPEGEGWGAPLEGTFVSGLSQEHGVLHVPAAQSHRLRVGELVCILPAHSCLTVQVMRQYRTLDGECIRTMNE
jgi:D-serine deaminase-like pyridoxal phosphate-dependent protein